MESIAMPNQLSSTKLPTMAIVSNVSIQAINSYPFPDPQQKVLALLCLLLAVLLSLD
jgi:hypothetical protein